MKTNLIYLFTLFLKITIGDTWIPPISNTTNDKATRKTMKAGRWRVHTTPIG